MISRISIENFIIIEKLDIIFEKGFTSITGETGTGKSIILDAINFCFGYFSSKNIRKFPEKPCIVEIEIDLKKKIHLLDQDITDYVSLKRVLNQTGKSSYYLNSSPISNKEIKIILPFFLDITAQYDTILSEEYQYYVFENFLKTSDKNSKNNLLQISGLYSRLKDLEEEIQISEKELEESKRYKSYNSQTISELGDLAIKENEETNLLSKRAQIAKLVSNNNLIKSSLELLQSCFGNSLYQAIKNLERINNNTTNEIVKRLENIDIETSDIISELKVFVENINSIELELSEIDERLSVLRTTARKYNTSTSTLFEFLEEAKNKIKFVETADTKLTRLKKEQIDLLNQYDEQAEKLSQARQLTAIELTKKICSNLRDLLMPNAIFKIEIEPNKLNRKQDGIDKVKFLASFNKEKNLQPISQIASGGEAARLNFALKISVGKYTNCNVIIFDEIDIGIGGSAAYAMGKLMKRFAKESDIQVISITHSPQVAAKSDTHLLIEKEIAQQNINVSVKKLNEEERVNEIARMISGDVINKEAILAAKQLIQKN